MILLSDQTTLATASADKTIGIWNLVNNTMIKQLLGHMLAVYSLAQISGDLLASGSGDGNIIIWNLTDYKKDSIISRHSTAVVALATLNSVLLASSSDETIKIINVNSGMVVSTLSGHLNYINSLIFLPGELYLISGSFDKTVKVWQLSGPSQNNLNANREISSIDLNSTVNTLISYNLSQFISGTADGMIHIFESAETETVLCEENSAIFSLAVLRTSYLASGSTNGRLSFWNLKNNRSFVKSLQIDKQFSVLSMAYIENGTIAVGLTSGIVKILKLNLPDDYYSAPTTTHQQTTMAFINDSQRISTDPSFRKSKTFSVNFYLFKIFS